MSSVAQGILGTQLLRSPCYNTFPRQHVSWIWPPCFIYRIVPSASPEGVSVKCQGEQGPLYVLRRQKKKQKKIFVISPQVSLTELENNQNI